MIITIVWCCHLGYPGQTWEYGLFCPATALRLWLFLQDRAARVFRGVGCISHCGFVMNYSWQIQRSQMSQTSRLSRTLNYNPHPPLPPHGAERPSRWSICRAPSFTSRGVYPWPKARVSKSVESFRLWGERGHKGNAWAYDATTVFARSNFKTLQPVLQCIVQ